MNTQRRVRIAVLATVALAALCVALACLIYPPVFTTRWLIALGTLLLLGILSAALALSVSEHGSTSTTLYVPYLASIPLLGPSGAVFLTALTELAGQFGFEKKPLNKAAFNIAQSTVSVGTASLLYVALGGGPNLTSLELGQTALPFLASAAVYFVINRAAVSLIMSLSEGEDIREMWRRLLGKLIVFDVAVSPIAYLVAFLFVEWGSLGLVLAVVPIFGLRYIYGANIKLRELNRDLLRVLIKTLEAQDPYTSGHSVRVAERAKIIAHSLGLGIAEIHRIETAALLHDLGKIDVRYHDILRQEGPLSEEQKELIRAHPERGVRIIKSVRSLDPEILSYVRHHHERYDGTGYPDGIAGDDIPLGARIIMVSDTIDAMKKARPYRDAVPTQEIKEELTRCKGTQFDPRVVDAAIEAGLLDSDMEEFEALGDETIRIEEIAL